MKYLRFNINNDDKYGILKGDIIFELNHSFLKSIDESGEKYNINSVKLLPPMIPSKIIALGYNYKDLVGKRENYDEPVIFIKPPSTLIGQGDIIKIRKSMVKVWTEVELCIVIGKTANNVSEKNAENHIFGYTIGNDVTTLNILNRDHHLARSKAWDTFCPLGPWIETKLKTENLNLTNSINGKIYQRSNTNMRIYNDIQIVSHLSKIMTLYPGDIIMTGTPDNAENSIIQDKDSVELSIQNLGVLSNRVKIIN